MHFPQAMPDIPENPDFITLERPTFNETWADMEKVYEAGKVKAIGVSNFSVQKYVHFLQSMHPSSTSADG